MSESIKGLPEWPARAEYFGRDAELLYHVDLIFALRTRLKLAVDSLERYQARCDDLAHDEGQWHHGVAECPVEARIASIIALCREPS